MGALSLVHWGRTLQCEASEIVYYLMGVLPNVAAAIAIPFVLLSTGLIRSQLQPIKLPVEALLAILTLVAGVGLIAWEFIQQSSRSLVYDYHDIAATIFGLVVAWLLFLLLTPRAME